MGEILAPGLLVEPYKSLGERLFYMYLAVVSVRTFCCDKLDATLVANKLLDKFVIFHSSVLGCYLLKGYAAPPASQITSAMNTTKHNTPTT